jgi:hypothetical protein
VAKELAYVAEALPALSHHSVILNTKLDVLENLAKCAQLEDAGLISEARLTSEVS